MFRHFLTSACILCGISKDCVKSRQIETGYFEQGMSENSLLLGEYYNFHRPEV